MIIFVIKVAFPSYSIATNNMLLLLLLHENQRKHQGVVICQALLDLWMSNNSLLVVVKSKSDALVKQYSS